MRKKEGETVEEIKKSGLTFRQAKKLVDACIRDVKDGFVATGYYLWVIREERLWEEDGYNSFPEFLHCQYQKDKSWASRCIGLYEQFGKAIAPGELPVLAAPYRDYSVSQLIEMVSMTEEQREQVTPDMKIREIREMKPKRKKKAAAALEGEVLAEAAGGEPEEQIPGQMELASYTEGSCDAATGEGRETSQEAQKPPKEAEVTRTTLEPKKGQETAQEALEGVREPDGDGATRVCAYREGFFCSLTREQQKTVGGKENCHVGCCWECESREECNLECISSASREETVAAEEEPLSAHGTPGKVYPEGSLIATAGYESKPGGPKGGYDCFSCARECEIRQKDRYCVEAPLGNPFPCGRMDVAGTLREAMGDKCQFVNLDLAYHRLGDGEPKPCCKDCSEQCDFRCSRAGGIIPELELVQEESSGLDGIPTPMEIKDYDRDSLMQMISNAEYEMKIMGDYWKEDMPKNYTKKAMEIQAYKNLLAEHDAAEAAQPDLADNPDLEQPELPVLKNNDQRKEWLKNYKSWGLWYRDEHIDVNYYKFDFDNGSRLVVAEYPQRESDWTSDKFDRVYYHLVEKGKKKYKSEKVYDDKYQDSPTSETELVEYLKRIQQKKKGDKG